MKKLIIIFLLAVSIGAKAQNEGAVKMVIMGKMMSLRNALIQKDSVALSKLLADDVTYGHTNGMIQTKAELIRSVVSGEQDYKEINPSAMNVRVFDNTGIVNMTSKVVLKYQDKPMEIDMKVTLVWIKDKEDWKLEARQAVKENKN